MRKMQLLCLVLLFATIQGFAQDANLTFHTETYNFGRVPKTSKPIQYDFVFQNTGVVPVQIANVASDCACATSAFPQTPIQANQEGIISVVFSPYRAGSFEKEFTVSLQNSKQTFTLKIKGFLLPYNSENTVNDFVYKNGSLKFRQKNLNLGTLTTHIAVTKKFYFYNNNKKNITFTNKISTPKHIKVFFDSSMTVKAGKIGAIVVTYNPKEKNAFDYLTDTITLHTTNKEKILITVAADVQPDTYIPDASGNMPSICIHETSQEIDNLLPEQDRITEFVVRNEGNVELKIHKIAASAGCEVISNIENIAPNESRTIKVRFLNTNQYGYQDRAFTIYSNDPYKSKQVVALRAR